MRQGELAFSVWKKSLLKNKVRRIKRIGERNNGVTLHEGHN